MTTTNFEKWQSVNFLPKGKDRANGIIVGVIASIYTQDTKQYAKIKANGKMYFKQTKDITLA